MPRPRRPEEPDVGPQVRFCGSWGRVTSPGYPTASLEAGTPEACPVLEAAGIEPLWQQIHNLVLAHDFAA